jgi:hypothetical protein
MPTHRGCTIVLFVVASLVGLREIHYVGHSNGARLHRAPVDLAPTHACLRQTLPGLILEYPVDAEQHFEAIHAAVAPWTKVRPHKVKGFAGPWIENVWIQHFSALWEQHKHNTTDANTPNAALQDVFGPYVPLFLPWTDIWLSGKRSYPPELTRLLYRMLRPDVPYITVVQNDQGLPANGAFDQKRTPSLLVLSAGGYGHVPVPLFRQSEPRNNRRPMAERQYLMSFVGSLSHAPNQLRQRMDHIAAQTIANQHANYTYYQGAHWRSIMADSCTSLVPRGFGRTAYHLIEILQMGLVPVYVYDDISWVPYADIFETFGFVAKLAHLPDLVKRIQQESSQGALQKREQTIVAMRDSHFTPDGVMRQVHAFMLGGQHQSDLRCQPLPSSLCGGCK